MCKASKSLTWIGLVFFTLVVLGCSDLPSGPSPSATTTTSVPPTTTLTVVSARTGATLKSGTVRVLGRSYSISAEGRVSIDNLTPGADISVEADGYRKPRDTRFRQDTVISLWPLGEPGYEVTDAYLDEIVYAPLYNPGSRLCRLRAGTTRVSLVLDETIRSARLRNNVVEAAARMTAALNGEIVYSVDDTSAPNAVRFDLGIDPNDPVVAVPENGTATYRNFDRYVVTGGRIVFKTEEEVIVSLVLQTLGYAFGLGQSPDFSEVMSFNHDRRRLQDFSPREKDTIKMMWKARHPGNAMPDDDRDASVNLLQAGEVITIAIPGTVAR